MLPALDLRGGRVVRLRQGDFARETVFDLEPLSRAQAYAEAGAEWLHLVDLDGAREARNGLADVVSAIARHTGMHVQIGGGVRRADEVARLLAAGARRVVIGSMAAREPARVGEWLQRFGAERLVLAFDARWRNGRWRVASAGWTREEPRTLNELVPLLASHGARHILCTDIDRDGTLAGPNVELYAELHSLAPDVKVQVSGGVRQLQDVCMARACGAAGIVIGRALLEGRFTVSEALAC